MRNYKSKIISKYGSSVRADRFNGTGFDSQKTKALLGRSSRNNNNMRTLNNQKEGIFLPDFDISSGDFVHHLGRSESFIVSGVHPEYDEDRILSYVVNLLTCRHFLVVKGLTRTADNRGNLKTEFERKYEENLPCHLQEVTNELRQYEVGIHPDTEYKVYTANISIAEADQVYITMNEKEVRFKVIAKDYVTFHGMVVLQVARDVR